MKRIQASPQRKQGWSVLSRPALEELKIEKPTTGYRLPATGARRRVSASPRPRVSPISGSRNGAVLVVVAALLGLLALIGFFFYTFAAQEGENAEYFAAAAKQVDASRLFDHALRQIILGANSTEYNSALHGGRHSMLANLFGQDSHPYSGQGVNLINDGSGNPVVDQNYTGGSSGDPNLLNFNDSPAAHGGIPANYEDYPQPDVDYTYPDINSLFLGYRGYGIEETTNNPVRVIIPSYHRPQYLRSGGSPIINWHENSTTVARSLRPHTQHRFMGIGYSGGPDGQPGVAMVDDDGANGTDDAGELGWPGSDDTKNGPPLNSRVLRVVTSPADVRRLGLTSAFEAATGQMGIWSNVSEFDFNLDADADGDGIREAVYLDLDFPLTDINGKRAVPLFAVSIYDADGLLNFNAHGNAEGEVNLAAPAAPLGNGNFISRSNMGLSPNEVNPQWGLYASINDLMAGDNEDRALTQHKRFYDPGNARAFTIPTSPLDASIPDSFDVANMEWYWALAGRPDFPSTSATVSDVYDYHAGRFGEPGRLAAEAGSADPAQFSQSGTFSFNDNEIQTALPTTPFVHPTDFRGAGRRFNDDPGIFGKLPGTYFHTDNVNQWIKYQDMSNPGGAIGWGQPFSAALMEVSNPSDAWLSARLAAPLMDEAYETYLDSTFPPQYGSTVADDNIFAPSENSFLQLSDGDLVTAGITSRLEKLLPYSLKNNTRAEEIRRNFTTTGWDLPSSGVERTAARPWEFSNIDNVDPSTDRLVFPPRFGSASERTWRPNTQYAASEVIYPRLATGRQYRCVADNLDPNLRSGRMDPQWPTVIGNTVDDGSFRWEAIADTSPQPDPFRPALRNWLRKAVNERDFPTGQFLTGRLLDLNKVLDEVTGLPRPLTDHPAADLAATAVSTAEAQARRDRQLMARDIYVMLYTFCGGNNSDYTTTNAGGVLYTDAQLQDMAQFAVNVVDALDPDDVITAFEFDKDLSDGWNPDDDPDTTADLFGPDALPGEDVFDDDNNGVVDDLTELGWTGSDDVGRTVYGVEAQQLAFNETLLIHSPFAAADESSTPYNDNEATVPRGRFFWFAELRNLTPFVVNLATTVSNDADTGVWRLMRDDNNNQFLDLPLVENVVVFKNDPANVVNPGAQFVIASSDSTHKVEDGSGIKHEPPSEFRVDYDSDTRYELIAPNLLDDAGMGDPDNSTIFEDYSLPLAELDLAHERDRLRFARPGDVLDPSDPTLDVKKHIFVDTDTDPRPPDTTTRILLQRRANPRLPSLPEALNPWVTVDAMDMGDSVRRDFAPASPNYSTLKSTERMQSRASDEEFPDLPADTVINPLLPRTSNDIHFNSIGLAVNLTLSSTRNEWVASTKYGIGSTVTPTTRNGYYYLCLTVAPGSPGESGIAEPDWDGPDDTITLPELVVDNNLTWVTVTHIDYWQAHFDRDFASVGELLSVPIASPMNLTRSLGLAGSGELTNAGAAGIVKFLMPVHTDNIVAPPGNAQLNNRWYRLLGMLEVPPYGSYTAAQRVAGKVNWNTVRSPATWAALVDDASILKLDSINRKLPGLDPNDSATGASGSFERDWWHEFIKARDGVAGGPDPTTDVYLPGVAGTNPFRAPLVAQENNPQSSLERTGFRDLIADRNDSSLGTLFPTELPIRRLLEVGTQVERYGTHGTPVDDGAVDHYTRNRLLSKVLNNSTTRSNVFFVFMQVDYFEAAPQFGRGPDNLPGRPTVDDDGDGTVDNDYGVGADMQPGIAGVDDDQNGTVDDASELGWPGSDDTTELGAVGSDDVEAVRIGGKLADSPGYRGFFVIDRSLAYRMLKEADFPDVDGPDNAPNTIDDDHGRFRFRSTDEGVGFDWRSLVIHRQQIR